MGRGEGKPSRRAPAPVRRLVVRVVDGVRGTVSTVLAGDRPYLLVVLVVLAIGALMMWAPLHHYLDGRDRVELLETKKAALAAEIQRLESRRDDLNDPDQIELLAREQLGLVRPGEIPYVVVTPEPDRPQLAPSGQVEVTDRPWYQRVWEAVTAALP
ncbi:MAG: septum formation initiator family protein [Actinobacteria bacterium]|nr:septum formation initiator family protein [Actinomycetota bacterium]